MVTAIICIMLYHLHSTFTLSTVLWIKMQNTMYTVASHTLN